MTKRKAKMHNEHEFDLDNIYQDDERQIDIATDHPFEVLHRQTSDTMSSRISVNQTFVFG